MSASPVVCHLLETPGTMEDKEKKKTNTIYRARNKRKFMRRNKGLST